VRYSNESRANTPTFPDIGENSCRVRDGCPSIYLATSYVFSADYGVTIVQVSTVKGAQARDAFEATYRVGRASRWRSVAYTTEGDPITYTVNSFWWVTPVNLIVDARQDHFGSREIEAYVCEMLVDEGYLRAVGCLGGQDGEVSIP
jgi:hypothetical protein